MHTDCCFTLGMDMIWLVQQLSYYCAKVLPASLKSRLRNIRSGGPFSVFVENICQGLQMGAVSAGLDNERDPSRTPNFQGQSLEGRQPHSANRSLQIPQSSACEWRQPVCLAQLQQPMQRKQVVCGSLRPTTFGHAFLSPAHVGT